MPSKQVLSVSALTALIKGSLEGSFSSVTVEGEISAAKLSSSGHLYFSLKDREALIQAVMFKFRLASLDFDLADGQKVIARGSVSVYAARGQYQLIVQSLARAGIGDLLAMIEERKQRLAAEGLFAPERKRPLPRLPSQVGVVTSPTGAAFHDILNVLGRRNSGTGIILLPAPVQGEGAAEIIARRIEQANRMGLADVLIVGRGGGSPEDLIAFSEERVVRAVAASKIPVISAVGHEIDWSLCDYAADVRAPTPSAAAELVAESRDALLGEIAQFRAALESSIRARLEYARLSLGAFSPEDVEARFMRILMPAARRFDDARDEIAQGMDSRLRESSRRVELCENSLELASPRSVLARGYSIVRKPAQEGAQAQSAAKNASILGEGVIVRSSSQLEAEDRLAIIFSEGNALVDVREVTI
jgi:exodeoxyribonuclease VII large subunit